MENKTFSKENFEALKSTCEKIISISKENVDGQLMASQLIFLGELIEEFAKNPIIENSGIVSLTANSFIK